MKILSKIALAATALVASVSAYAESLFPTTLATTFATDVGDTVAEGQTWLIGIMFVIGAVFFAVNFVKRGLGKAGAR